MITIPTIAQLNTAILNNLSTEFDAIIQPEGKAQLRAQAAVQAAKLHLQYLAIAETQKNVFVDICDEPTLIRFGRVKLNREPFSAVAGQYKIAVTGTIGAIISIGTIFKSDDDALNPGILYRLDEQYTLVNTTDFITVRSLTLGIESKLQDGDTLTATAPIPQVDSIATVDDEVIQPLSAESMEDYRQKCIEAFRLEAQGGAATDYRIWAADAQGVQRVYPYAKPNAPCEINLFIEATIADSIDGKGTPTPQIIADVEAVVNFDPDTSLPLNERGRRPLQVIVNYEAVTPKVIEITITNFQDITPAIQAQLLLAFTSSISRVRPYVAAAEPISEKNDVLDTNTLNGIIYTTRPGSQYDTVTFKVDGILTNSIQFTNGDIPYLNPIIIYV